MAVCVILVEPENPDNIGAVCRAMKNMSLRDLRLVKPPTDWRKKAEKMALWAKDVLADARTFPSLQEAVGDAVFVLATTRRRRNKGGSYIGFDEAVRKIVSIRRKETAALVFGKESKGLSNEDLFGCDAFTTIPSSSAYPSLNLAQAVMVMVFSLFNHEKEPDPGADLCLIDKAEVESTLDRFKEAVACLGYKPSIEKRIGITFHSLVKRSGLLKSESQMIKGLSRRIRERISSQKNCEYRILKLPRAS